MIGREDITGVILCGGSGARMGGVEKPLELFLGAPMVQHVRERLLPQVTRVVISANRERDRYAAWGDAVVADNLVDAGPLAGLFAALAPVRTPYLFCCPGDTPLLDTTLVSRLAASVTSTDIVVAFPDDGVRPQHLFMLLRAAPATVSLEAYLAAGHRSVHGWLATVQHTVVRARDIAGSFVNVNTPQQLSALERRVFA